MKFPESAFLGVELGSTRIKAVLIGPENTAIASGEFDWENERVNGWWSYSESAIRQGLQTAYHRLKEEVQCKYGTVLSRVDAIGISAMMHGYLVLDKNDALLTPFRTWRNTATTEAAEELSQLFDFHIPERWSIAHLLHAARHHEEHLPRIARMTTLAGYIHYLLTGESVVGIGEASGMFPVDDATGGYDAEMLARFDALHVLPFSLASILPQVKRAGERAGCLTAEGARFLDPQGDLLPGIPLCPPEGDAGTGMVATNSVRACTGNISAGTSVFAMLVLEHGLRRSHREIDIVATPSGKSVAMVHCNTCTSDLDAWVKCTGEILADHGIELKKSELYEYFYRKAFEGAPDCDGLTTYNFYAGEPVLGLDEGVPTLTRSPERPLTYANLARSLTYSAIATLRVGMDILKEENVSMKKLTGHGGFFKSEVAQSITAAALDTPIATMASAGEGGAWGIAILAKYLIEKADGESLEDYLDRAIFADADSRTAAPDPALVRGFADYLERYRQGVERMKR